MLNRFYFDGRLLIKARHVSFQLRLLVKTFKTFSLCLCLHKVSTSEKYCVENGQMVFLVCLQKGVSWGVLVCTLQSVLSRAGVPISRAMLLPSTLHAFAFAEDCAAGTIQLKVGHLSTLKETEEVFLKAHSVGPRQPCWSYLAEFV